jgi:hypothetical protein
MSKGQKVNMLPIVVMFLLFFMIAFVTNFAGSMGVIVKSQFGASNAMAQLGTLANFIAYANDKKRAEQMARPRHYRCRYCGNGICTLRSDSVTMITCDYVANPEYCPSVRQNRRYLETVYDD